MPRRSPKPTTVGGVASIPSRASMLQQMVASVLPQLDRLAVYLNGYDEVPAFLADDRIAVFRSQTHGDRGDAGKFFTTAALEDGVYFSLDDDLLYPPDYTAHMLSRLRAVGNRAVLGVHGVVYPRQPTSFFDRGVIRFSVPNRHLRLVSLVGTGTACFSTRDVRVSPSIFRSGSMADIWLGVHLKRTGVPAVCVDRAEGWLRAVEPTTTDSLYDVTVRWSRPHERLIRSAAPWGREDLIARAHRAQLGRLVPPWLTTPDLATARGSNGDSREDWPVFLPSVEDDHHHLAYFTATEQLELALASAREGRPLSEVQAYVRAGRRHSAEAAVECVEQLWASAHDDQLRRELSPYLARALRDRGRPARAIALTDAGARTKALTLERAYALLDLGRAKAALDELAESPSAAELEFAAELIEVVRYGNEREVARLVVDVAARPALRDVRAFMPTWLGRRGRSSSERSLQLAALESAGTAPAFDHVFAVRCFQALRWVELSRFWLRRFAHGLGFDPNSYAGYLRFAQLQPTLEDALVVLNGVWARAGLLGVSVVKPAFAAVRWPERIRFGEANPVRGRDVVSLLLTGPDGADAAAMRAALSAAVQQTYRPLEVVLVGRAASSVENLCDGVDDVRVVRVRSEPDRDAVGERDAGIDAASGRFIAFHPVGNVFHPERITHQLELIRRFGAVASVAPGVRFSSEGTPAAGRDGIPDHVLVETTVIERAALASLRGADSSLPRKQDLLEDVARAMGRSFITTAAVPLVLAEASTGGAGSTSRQALRGSPVA